MTAPDRPATGTRTDGNTGTVGGPGEDKNTGADGLGGVSGLVAGVVPFSAVDGPGNRYVVFLQGCGFDCLVCHNPVTIPLRPKGLRPQTADGLLAGIADAAPFLTGVTVTGGEPTCQPDFTYALFARLAADPRTARLHRLLDSNGDAPAEVWDRLVPVIDGAMIDLKALDDEAHLVLTGTSNVRVLAAIRNLAGRGLLAEVRLLLVPGLNDADDVLTRTASWLLAVDPAVRVRVNPFRQDGTRACARGLHVPDPSERDRYRRVLTAAGITDLILTGDPSRN
ncbi:MAG TPA: radical SAM protein [Kineosporiaceae bacterium]|nr:radical SAM protein [Kineosporiaceae bacterium]